MNTKLIWINATAVAILLALPLVMPPLFIRWMPDLFDNLVGVCVIGAIVVALWVFVMVFMIPPFGHYSSDGHRRMLQKTYLYTITAIIFIAIGYCILRYLYPSLTPDFETALPTG